MTIQTRIRPRRPRRRLLWPARRITAAEAYFADLHRVRASDDAILMTNALINSAPLVANINDPEERSKLVNKVIYPVSRAQWLSSTAL